MVGVEGTTVPATVVPGVTGTVVGFTAVPACVAMVVVVVPVDMAAVFCWIGNRQLI